MDHGTTWSAFFCNQVVEPSFEPLSAAMNHSPKTRYSSINVADCQFALPNASTARESIERPTRHDSREITKVVFGVD